MRLRVLALLFWVCWPACFAFSETKPSGNAVYRQLRSISTSGDLVLVENVVLKRDAGTFTFKSGHIAFLTPIEGKVTGAVFIGEGTFTLDPPIAVEKANLRLLTNEPQFNESFGEVVFRFTDGTYEELKKAGTVPKEPVVSAASGLLQELNYNLRKSLQYNIHARILQDVLSQAPGGYFAAFIKGKKYSPREAFVIDPHGVQSMAPMHMPQLNLAPEEVAFMTYEDVGSRKFGIWAAFHYSSEYATGKATGSQQNGAVRIEHQKIDTTIEKGGRLTGKAETTIVAQSNSVRVVSLDLHHYLRVTSVKDTDGKPLDFIQQDKDEDADFAVILSRNLAAGEHYTIISEYSGVQVVFNEGGGNYYSGARTNWYPNTSFGEYATYDLTFHIPRGLRMIATGTLVRQADEGEHNVSVWHSDTPIAAAGFNFGKFKEEEKKLDKPFFTVEAFANTEAPDLLVGLSKQQEDFEWQHNVRTYGGTKTMGTFDTTPLLKKAFAEAQLAIPLYTEYFGPTPFKSLAMTQQTAPTYGQSWPGLVYLPVTSFLDNTTRHQLGMSDIDTRGYFQVVGPHEIAHQWWGHTVGFHSYRDQWISEGFAELSASIFLQAFYPKDQFGKFWRDERLLLTEKNEMGHRAIDVGPITLGYRLMSGKMGFSTPRRIIYPKGGYILHMVRMMLYDTQAEDPDARFKQLMHDFVSTHTLKPATTEDFKAAIERHMIAPMNVTGDGKMDWFFNEWVYGTAMPTYKFENNFGRAPDGTITLHLKLSQSGVDDSFVMPLAIYLELPSGRIMRIGMVPMKGNSTFEKTIALRGLQSEPRRAMVNYFYDVLCN